MASSLRGRWMWVWLRASTKPVALKTRRTSWDVHHKLILANITLNIYEYHLIYTSKNHKLIFIDVAFQHVPKRGRLPSLDRNRESAGKPLFEVNKLENMETSCVFVAVLSNHPFPIQGCSDEVIKVPQTPAPDRVKGSPSFVQGMAWPRCSTFVESLPPRHFWEGLKLETLRRFTSPNLETCWNLEVEQKHSKELCWNFNLGPPYQLDLSTPRASSIWQVSSSANFGVALFFAIDEKLKQISVSLSWILIYFFRNQCHHSKEVMSSGHNSTHLTDSKLVQKIPWWPVDDPWVKLMEDHNSLVVKNRWFGFSWEWDAHSNPVGKSCQKPHILYFPIKPCKKKTCSDALTHHIWLPNVALYQISLLRRFPGWKVQDPSRHGSRLGVHWPSLATSWGSQ